jgi:hypothetical protein
MFYGEIRSYTERIWHVYGTVYGRKRPFTESITVDLGSKHFFFFLGDISIVPTDDAQQQTSGNNESIINKVNIKGFCKSC